MKPISLSQATLRASRVFASAAWLAAAILLTTFALDPPWFAANSTAWPPPLGAVVVILLASGALLLSVSHPSARAGGQLLALAAGALALSSASQSWFGFWNGSDLWILPDVVARYSLGVDGHPGRLTGASSILLASTSLALLAAPRTAQRTAPVFTFVAGTGLSLVAATVVGIALGNDPLARLGLDQAPALSVPVMAGVLLIAALAQRGNAGWLAVLLGPSAAGSSARGILAWTLVGPLLLAATALGGVRAGLYSLDFAYASLAAATCGGLTWLVLWNAARVERAQQRAERDRDALTVAAARLRLAQSATGVHLWEWTPRTREWLALDDRERLDPSLNEYLEVGLTRCLRDGKAEFEYPTGEERWMLATCWREMRGNLPIIAGVSVDISERKRAALALEASETRLQLAACALPGFVYDWNCASGKMLRTSGVEAMLGFQAAEISPANRWWEDLIHPDDREVARPARVAQVASAGLETDTVSSEYRVRHKDGRYVWVWDHCVLVRDRAGIVVRVVGTVLDITERKETHTRLRATEQRLRDSLQRLELAMDAASIGMWDWDLDSGQMTFTRQTHLITGIDETAFSGRAEDFFRLLLPADVDHGAQFLRDIALPGVVRQSELRIRRPDGTERGVQNRATAIVDDAGRMCGIVGTLRDITRRQELELEREALLAAERAARADLAAAAQAKDEFLATISHELRTPLNAILGWTTLLQRPKVDPATIPEGLKVIERNARAQTQLLGDLLDANQLVSGKMSLSFEPMNLNEAVTATLDSLRVTIAARKIRVESHLCGDPLLVMGDSHRLQQIVSNLLSNALKFTPHDGVVSIITRADSDVACCEVRDTGEGIAAEFLPHLFEKFRQADGGSARRFKGLGLGLAITKQLVEAHGGSISVSSAGRGKGAAFVVKLPYLKAGDFQAGLESVHEASASDRPLRGLRILAVDDEADSREYLKRLLAEQGAEIVSVSSAAEAIDELSADTGRFNLLVSDIGMPGSTGYDLIDTVRGRLKMDAMALPAIALTAFTRREDSNRAIERGFQKHLAKPVQVGRLIGAIRELTKGQMARPQAVKAQRGEARSADAIRH
jgi:PAS domain S-box-containing protein